MFSTGAATAPLETLGLYTLDRNSGVATLVAETASAEFTGMTFDPATDTMYAVKANGTLATIELATAVVTDAGPFGLVGFHAYYGLAYQSPSKPNTPANLRAVESIYAFPDYASVNASYDASLEDADHPAAAFYSLRRRVGASA